MKHADLLLIYKVLSGEITECKKAEFQHWLTLDSKNLEEFEMFKLIWDLIDLEEDYFEEDSFEEDNLYYDPEEEISKLLLRIRAARESRD